MRFKEVIMNDAGFVAEERRITHEVPRTKNKKRNKVSYLMDYIETYDPDILIVETEEYSMCTRKHDDGLPYTSHTSAAVTTIQNTLRNRGLSYYVHALGKQSKSKIALVKKEKGDS